MARKDDTATAADLIRNIAFYAAFYFGTVFFVLGAMVAAFIADEPLRRVVRGWSAYHRMCARYLLGLKLRIEGELPDEGLIVAMKHESFYEAIDLPVLMNHPAPFPKAELARLPGWGWAARRYGIVVVERDEGAKALRAMVANAKVFAGKGRPLVIFPEGTRVPHGKQPGLQAGFAGVYKLLGLPVVPIAVNSGPLYHRRWKRPGTITMRVGERIEPGLPRAEIEARVLQAINALND